MKLAVKSVIVVVLLHLSSIVTGQEIIEPCDSISVDEMVVDTVSADELMNDMPIVTQYDLKEYEWVDICNNPKYAIVSKDGKKGIYDMMLHKNVTEIEYRDLGFSKQTSVCFMLQRVLNGVS